MRRRTVVLTILFLLSPLAAPQQQRHGASPQPNAPSAAPNPVDPDVQKLEHAAEVQATADQTEKFHTMLDSTRLALQQAGDLQRQAVISNDSIELTHRATTLEDSLDQALTDYRSFRRSLAQQQEAEEKPLIKKLTKAASSVSKDGDAMSQRLQQVPLDPRKLASLAEHLEKELSAFQAAQAGLGKEMGIESQ